MQLVPADDVERLPAGHGRAEPNTNPTLPAPTGRLRFTLNPCKMLLRLVGPKYFARACQALCCAFCALFGLLLAYNVLPVVIGNAIV